MGTLQVGLVLYAWLYFLRDLKNSEQDIRVYSRQVSIVLFCVQSNLNADCKYYKLVAIFAADLNANAVYHAWENGPVRRSVNNRHI